MTLRRATERLREVGSLPVLLIALLIAMSGDLLSAQDRSRSRSNDSSYSGRSATPRADSSPSRSPSPSAPPRTASPSSPPSSSSGPSASSPSRRHAVPGSPGAPHRQPPSRDRRDPDWNGGHGHHGHGHGGYYYPHWYGYYGASWWWVPYGYWGWGWGWPYGPYYGYGYPSYGGYGGYGHYDRGDGAGALDLDISPGRTQVYLDGQYIGTVDQYDGFPTYLWLEKGTYDIAFYLDGYTTLARQVSVYPGTVIDMEDRLQPGVSVRPEDLVSKSHERRDARERFERERRERIDRGEDPYVEEEEDWRDRFDRDWEDLRGKGEEIEIEDERDNGRTEQGRVRLEVEPDDASVYLDGKFVGTAQDLSNLRNGLLVDPGKHSVAVVRPGREGVEREFEVESGEELELEIELEPATR